MRALFAGSFDPVTNGHLDLICRVAPLVDALIVAVSVNRAKNPFFPDEERVELLRAACLNWPGVEVVSFCGLVVEAARAHKADFLVRGVRGYADFEHEMTMAQTNRALTGIETLLLPANPKCSYVSSSLVKEVAFFGGDISRFVPEVVAERMRERMASRPLNESS